MFRCVSCAEPVVLPYQPFYCEENTWQILAGPFISGPAEALLIANPFGRVACWGSRAAPPDEAIGWDYHVVALGLTPEVHIVDPDCRAGPTLPLAEWLTLTFRDPDDVRARYHPRFRAVPRDVWLTDFATDRSHMRGRDGRYRRPPPPWDPPNAPRMNLMQWLDQRHVDWVDRATLEERHGLTPSRPPPRA